MLKSHPDKLLEDHLLNVANNCRYTLLSKKFGNLLVNKDVLLDLCFYVGLFHDVGKATTYFQEYIQNPDKTTTELKNHSHISALLAFIFIYKNLDSFDVANELIKNLLPYLVYNAIRRHHSYLHDFDSELPFDIEKNIFQQIEALDLNSLEKIFENINNKLKIKIFFKDLILELQKVKSNSNTNIWVYLTSDFSFNFFRLEKFKQLSENDRIQIYLIQNLIYGTLILSDRKDVILNDTPQISENVNFNKIQEYRKNKFYSSNNNEIINFRSKCYDDTINFIENNFQNNNYIYSLTLPTGLGKTILSLALATKFKELLGEKNYKTIISIPFTSIIDQSYEVYKEIVGTDNSNILLKHHYRSDFKYKIDENKYKYNEIELLLETWHSEIIVTTFVQLLETIFSNDKQKLMKLPSIINSIIILDEVQTIQYNLWKLINKTFQIIGQTFNTYFILCTATQPLIFLPDKEIKEITKNNDSYFKFFNRTCILPKLKNSVSINEFQELVYKYIIDNPNDDILIIVNTKKLALTLFKYFAEIVDQKDDVFYLSTLITPYERKRIIEYIKNYRKKRKVIISTQLVEAGVDISVNVVFREIAPIDALIQSAGRANRNGEFDKISPVFIYEIEENKSFTRKIYSIDLIQKTYNILKHYDIIYETDYKELGSKYFSELYNKATELQNNYFNYMLEFKFNEVGKFELIKDFKTESIYVYINEEAKELFNKYVELMRNEKLNNFEKKEEFSKIKSRFYDYVVQVQIPISKSEINFDSEKILEFYIADLEKTRFYHYSADNYRLNTGYEDEVSLLVY